MSQNSAIEWTESTWNPVRGCTKVSPGCANCYAETFAERWRGVPNHAYEHGFDLRLVPDKLDEPLHWKKPTTCFVNSMSDLFQEDVPDEFIDRVFAVMALAPQHTFQILTKRGDRMRQYFRLLEDSNGLTREERIDRAAEGFGACHANLDAPGRWPLPNVWLGVSVENQHFADERIPLLLGTPAAVRFISAEPLLGPVDLDRGGWSFLQPLRPPPGNRRGHESGLDWVIVGGESGHSARPFNVGWARSIVAQCRAAGVAVFVKQIGAKPYEPYSDGTPFVDLHVKARKGNDPTEWPEDLRVREMPTGTD